MYFIQKGLLMGASFLSFVEILELIFSMLQIIINRYTSRKNKKRDILDTLV